MTCANLAWQLINGGALIRFVRHFAQLQRSAAWPRIVYRQAATNSISFATNEATTGRRTAHEFRLALPRGEARATLLSSYAEQDYLSLYKTHNFLQIEAVHGQDN